jgi:hypothetical protein
MGEFMSNLIVNLVIWAVLATVLVFLALYRRRIYLKSDEVLHVLDAEAPLVSNQAEIGKRLEKIDLWGKTLTVIVALYGLGIAGWYLYSLFADTSIKMG